MADEELGHVTKDAVDFIIGDLFNKATGAMHDLALGVGESAALGELPFVGPVVGLARGAVGERILGKFG